jgi:hypothetical protein
MAVAILSVFDGGIDKSVFGGYTWITFFDWKDVVICRPLLANCYRHSRRKQGQALNAYPNIPSFCVQNKHFDGPYFTDYFCIVQEFLIKLLTSEILSLPALIIRYV